MKWHLLSIEDTLKETGSNNAGLTDAEANHKLEEHGKNELKATRKLSPVFIFFRQFIDVMILVLILAAVISYFIGELSDTIVILVIIVLNAVIGFIQNTVPKKPWRHCKKWPRRCRML